MKDINICITLAENDNPVGQKDIWVQLAKSVKKLAVQPLQTEAEKLSDGLQD